MTKSNKTETPSDPKIFQDIAEFWTYQLNNEIFLRNYPDVERGSREYFEIILSARRMCAGFSACDIKTEYLYGACWGRIYDFTPKPVYHVLSKLIGWHQAIYLKK